MSIPAAASVSAPGAISMNSVFSHTVFSSGFPVDVNPQGERRVHTNFARERPSGRLVENVLPLLESSGFRDGISCAAANTKCPETAKRWRGEWVRC
jgi:hypothetical protein